MSNNQPSHFRQQKSFASKYGTRRSNVPEQVIHYNESEDMKVPDYGVPSKESKSLFDRINKIFDDPSKDPELYGYDADYFSPVQQPSNVAQKAHVPSTRSSTSSGLNVLEKAKSLLEKKSSEIPIAKEKQKMKMMKAQKENTFVTGVGLFQEDDDDSKKKQVKKPEVEEPEEDDRDSEEFDENAYLKDLKATEYDDLEELRRMIAATKKKIHGYAGEVYSLKNSINDLNLGYKDTGIGFDDDLFNEMDREHYRFNRSNGGSSMSTGGTGDTRKTMEDLRLKKSTTSINGKKSTFVIAGSSAYSSQSSIKKPAPVVRQPVLDKVFGSISTQQDTMFSSASKPPSNSKFSRGSVSGNQPISGSTTKSMRSTFY